MSFGEARHVALLKLGGIQQTKENYCDARSFPQKRSHSAKVHS